MSTTSDESALKIKALLMRVAEFATVSFVGEKPNRIGIIQFIMP